MVPTATILVLVFLRAVSSLPLRGALTPPLLDVPVYSVATLGDTGVTNMNIHTYATPVSVSPDRLWSLGLYQETLTHANFLRTGEGVLQLLRPHHADVVRLLGGSSGRDVDKRTESARIGYSWLDPRDLGKKGWGFADSEGSSPLLLPGCVRYLKLRLVGEPLDGGSHHVVLCRVEGMLMDGEDDDTTHLSTAALRDMGIISELGRVVQTWDGQ